MKSYHTSIASSGRVLVHPEMLCESGPFGSRDDRTRDTEYPDTSAESNVVDDARELVRSAGQYLGLRRCCPEEASSYVGEADLALYKSTGSLPHQKRAGVSRWGTGWGPKWRLYATQTPPCRATEEPESPAVTAHRPIEVRGTGWRVNLVPTDSPHRSTA